MEAQVPSRTSAKQCYIKSQMTI